jgi:predicted nicotinamide N-methyase
VTDIDPSDSRRTTPCECEYCQRGLTATRHGDASHDERLVQDFIVAGAPVRVLLDYALSHPDTFRDKRVLELGAGAGLVSIGLAVGLGCTVDATDQEPVLELLQFNLEANAAAVGGRVRASALQWGEGLGAWSGRHDLIVGADVHFARENAPPLLATLSALAVMPGTAIVLAWQPRADWERELIEALERQFQSDQLVDAGDVIVTRYVPRPGPGVGA